MTKGLEKKILLAGTLAGALGLGGCASTGPNDAGDLYLQYSNIAVNTEVLKEKTKAVGNPFEYQILDIKKVYEAGFIKDFDQDFDNHYATLSSDEDKLAALASETLLTFPSGINYDNVLANDCMAIGNGKYSCDIGTFKSGLLDARMGAYIGHMERIKSESWREWSNFSEPLSASIWATALSYAFASNSGAVCKSLGHGSSTSNIGDANTIGSLGGSTSSGTIGVGGQVVIDLLSGKGC